MKRLLLARSAARSAVSSVATALAGSLASALALALAGTAHAGPATNDAATHFQAIASGDLGVLMRGYHDSAQLQWLGGPLDGSYSGVAAIRGVWEKFGKAQGPLKATVESVEESANPKGATVTANGLFVGKAPLKVRHVLVYRDNMIVSETWQIDPKLALGSAATVPAAAATAPY